MNTKLPGHILEDGAMSASISRVIIDLQGAQWFSIEAQSASATHAGTFTVEVSNSGSNWHTYTTKTVSAGSAFSEFIDNIRTCAKLMGISYTRSSGTGTLNVYVHPKRRN